MKLFSKIGTWVMIGILLIVAVSMAIIGKKAYEPYKNPERWKQETAEKKIKIEGMIMKMLVQRMKNLLLNKVI
jgi:hypothetical protein